jgi:hypothetical protein
MPVVGHGILPAPVLALPAAVCETLLRSVTDFSPTAFDFRLKGCKQVACDQACLVNISGFVTTIGRVP